MNSYESIFKEMGESARAASIVLQQLPEKRINEVLCAMADALVQHSELILTANHMDMDSARGVVLIRCWIDYYYLKSALIKWQKVFVKLVYYHHR